MNQSEPIGAQIRRRREEIGMSTRELAKKANMDYSHLWRIEKGMVNPKRKTIIVIEQAIMMESQRIETMFSPNVELENFNTKEEVKKGRRILDQLLEEINDLRLYEKMYQEQKNELREMSNQLYKLMMEKYNSTPYEERVKLFEDNTCKYCKDKYYCQINELPEDIMKPMPTNGRIPKTVGCGKNQ